MHRFTTSRGIELIKKLEGFSKTVYRCPGGYSTIGYGHKLSTSEIYNNISAAEAEDILITDLLCIEKAVMRYIHARLTDYQFDALVSFTFNCGPSALQRSTLRQKINSRLYDDAAIEFLKWVHVGFKKMAGLMHRRQIESRLFMGEW